MFHVVVRSMVVVAAQISVAQTPTLRAATKPIDSAGVVRMARSAQNSFESFRRNHLPFGQRSSGYCDVHIGRYCYWRGDEADDQPPPPEEPRIVERRSGLITVLENASGNVRGDPWIAGQLVRYLVEAERYEDAVAFARTRCEAPAGWCSALAGYAAHTGGHFALADSAYTIALAAMDSTERCRWLDISDLVEGDVEHRLSGLSCAERERIERRLFRLGAPLYSVSETDLLTEHLARITRAKMAERSASVDGQPFADDARSLMLRYGWSRWYSRTQPALGSMAEPSYTGHDRGVPYNFFPRASALDHLGHVGDDDWALDEPRAQAGYSATYARTVHDLPHQIAYFRRGDSTVVVAAWDARRDTTLIGRPLDAALVIVDADAERAVAKRGDAKAVGRIAVSAVLDSGIASLELLAVKDRRAARARIGVPPRADSAIAMSDLLLYSPTSDTPYTLDAVKDSALSSTTIMGSRNLGVYWETYGLADVSGSAKFALTVEQTSVGWMHRAAEQLHLADPTTALSVRWEEIPRLTDGIAGRGVRVDLGQLRSGKYRMTLSVTVPGHAPVLVTRDLELR